MSLDSLAQEVGGKIPPIQGIGSIMVDSEGFMMMNVKGYNKDQIAIVMDDPGMKDCPVILGTPTVFRVMAVIKESEISELAIPWASSRVSWLLRGVHAQMSQLTVDDVANKLVAPLSVHKVVRVVHDIFSLEKHDMGHTKATKHKIVLKDPDTPPFKERFRRIPPPQLDEVREHLKLMLDAGVVRPSNSPWCNAVVLVRKKDGSLHFCIDF